MGFKIFFGSNAPPPRHKCPKEGQPRSDFKLDPLIVRYIVVFILLALYYKLNKSPLPPSEAAYISSIASHFIYCFTHVRKPSFMAMLTDLYKSVVLLNNIICNFRWKRRPVASLRVTGDYYSNQEPCTQRRLAILVILLTTQLYIDIPVAKS